MGDITWNCEIVPCYKPASFWELTDVLIDPESIENACQSSLLRICALMRKMGAQTVIREYLTDLANQKLAEVPSDILEDLEDLISYFDDKHKFSFKALERITFLDNKIAPGAYSSLQLPEHTKECNDDNYLAQIYVFSFSLSSSDANGKESSTTYVYIPHGVVGIPSKPPVCMIHGLDPLCNTRTGEHESCPLAGDRPGQLPSEMADRCVNRGSRRPLSNYYIHVSRNYALHVGGNYTRKGRNNKKTKFSIIGTFFCSQNTFTSVCGHAAIRMLVNSIPSDIMATNREINTLAKLNPKESIYGVNIENSFGLNTMQAADVLTQWGFLVEPYDFGEKPNLDYASCAHRLLEGNSPSLLALTTHTSNHVVPVIGHTLNTDTWRPEAEFAYYLSRQQLAVGPDQDYIPASAWMNNLIIHDDNFGPYSCLPVDSLRRFTLFKYDRSFRAKHVLGLIKPNTGQPSPAQLVEVAAFNALNYLINTCGEIIKDHLIAIGKIDGDRITWGNTISDAYKKRVLTRSEKVLDLLEASFWGKKLLDYFDKQSLVIRTSLTHRSEYENHLKTCLDWKDIGYTKEDCSHILSSIPEVEEEGSDSAGWFYLVEVTLPDLYATNRTKLVDIIMPKRLPPSVAIFNKVHKKLHQQVDLAQQADTSLDTIKTTKVLLEEIPPSLGSYDSGGAPESAGYIKFPGFGIRNPCRMGEKSAFDIRQFQVASHFPLIRANPLSVPIDEW